MLLLAYVMVNLDVKRLADCTLSQFPAAVFLALAIPIVKRMHTTVSDEGQWHCSIIRVSS